MEKNLGDLRLENFQNMTFKENLWFLWYNKKRKLFWSGVEFTGKGD